jgi:NADPH2:quinone reductase
MKAIVVKSFGGPEVMEYVEHREPVAGKNQILVNTRMIGVNYADTYQTENSYLVQTLPPVVPGIEASFELDGKIFVGHTASGAYAEKLIVNRDRMFEIPEGVSEEEALSVICQGTTAYGIVNEICNIQSGDLVLINGASSAVGMILIQLCKNIGATVIGVTGTEKKIDFIKDLGVDFACSDDISEVRKTIKSIGKQPKFILESYGGKSFMDYYSMLQTGGHICSYGASSREGLPPMQLRDLLKDTKIVSGFWGTKMFGDSEKLSIAVNSLFDLIKNKKIKIIIGDSMELKDAKIMHEKMRNRDTLGKLILINSDGMSL